MGSYRNLSASQYGLRKTATSDTQYAWDDPSDDEDSPEYSPHPVSTKTKTKAQSSTKLADKREKNRLKQRKYRARQANMIESLQSDNQALRAKNQALIGQAKKLLELLGELRKENSESDAASCTPTFPADSEEDMVNARRCRNEKPEVEQTNGNTHTDLVIERDSSLRDWQAGTCFGEMDQRSSSSYDSSPPVPSNEFSSPDMSFTFAPVEPCVRPMPENYFWADPYELDDLQSYRANQHGQLDRQSVYPISTPAEESTMQTQPFNEWYSHGSDQRSFECPSGVTSGLFNRDAFPTPAMSTISLSGVSYAERELDLSYALSPKQVHSRTNIQASTISSAASRYSSESKKSNNVLGLSRLGASNEYKHSQCFDRTADDGMSTMTAMSFGLMSPRIQDTLPTPVPMNVGMLTRGRKQAGYRH